MIQKLSILLIIFKLGLISNFIKAQPFESVFGQFSTKWYMIPYGVCDGMFTMTTSVIGDSTNNGNNYKEVDNYSAFSYDTGFLRKDTVTGKVWLYDKTIDKEILVMDLLLNKSDSFKIFNYALDSNYIYVDTLFINNGIRHIRFKHCYIH